MAPSSPGVWGSEWPECFLQKCLEGAELNTAKSFPGRVNPNPLGSGEIDLCLTFLPCKASSAAGSEPDKQIKEGVGRHRTPNRVKEVSRGKNSVRNVPCGFPGAGGR